MNIKEILNSIFIFPAIKAGFRERIWEENIDKKLIPVKEIWRELGLLDKNKLSQKGEQLYDILPLIDYYLSLKDDFFNFSIHDDYKTDNDQYQLLREGLESFHNNFNSQIFQYFNFRDKEWNVLDYGGGVGQYLIDFIKYNPNSSGLLVDRNKVNREEFNNNIKSKAINFETDLQWYEEYEDKFNLIILSELLHCKNRLMQEYLIDTCWTMLKPNGILLINEVIPNAIFDWRMSMYSNGGKSISIEEIRSLTSDQWEEHRCYKNGTNDINYHYQITFKAIKE